MKRTIIWWAAYCLAAVAYGQTPVLLEESTSGIKEVVIDCEWADVTLQNWDGSSIKVQGTYSINLGEDDAAFQFGLVRDGDEMHFRSTIPDKDDLAEYVQFELKGKQYYEKIDTPSKRWKDYEKLVPAGVHSVSIGPIIEIDLVVLVPKDIKLTAELTYGDLVLDHLGNDMDVESRYGMVEAEFSGLPSECNLTSGYSFVDVAIPASARAHITLSSEHGNVYSNLDLERSSADGIRQLKSQRIEATLNRGGGPRLRVNAPYDDIYLRGK